MGRESRLSFFLFSATLAIIGLHIYGALDHSIDTWGFNHLSVMPLWAVYLTCGIATALAVLAWRVDGDIITRLRAGFQPIESKATRIAVTVSLWALVAVVLYLLRSRALAYGDGFLELGILSDVESDFVFDLYGFRIGSVLLRDSLYRGTLSVFEIQSSTFYSLYSVAGGLVGALAVWKICNSLFSEIKASSLMVVSLTSASCLLFFGHIEHYTWPMSLGLWSMYFAVCELRYSNRALEALLFGALAASLHLVAASWLVAVAVAVVWSRLLRDKVSFARLSLVLSVIGVAFSVILVITTGPHDASTIFVALSDKPDYIYGVLSSGHLRDILNLGLYLSPLVVCLPLALFGGNNKFAESIETHFVGLTTFALFLPVFWIDPKLGAVRDWDLLAGFGIPLSMFVGLKVLQLSQNNIHRLFFAALAVFVVHQVPSIYEKIDGERSTRHLDAMIWDDPHYQIEHNHGERNQTWGRLLRRSANLPELSTKYFERAVTGDPQDYHSWTHLGELAMEQNIYDSSARCFERAVALSPPQGGLLQRLAVSQYLNRDLEKALEAITKAEKISEPHYTIAVTKGTILYELSRWAEAFNVFNQAVELGGRDPIIQVYLGELHLQAGRLDSAYYRLSWCAKNFPDRPEYYRPFIETLIRLGNLEDAKIAMASWRRLSPPPDIYREFVNRIKSIESAAQGE